MSISVIRECILSLLFCNKDCIESAMRSIENISVATTIYLNLRLDVLATTGSKLIANLSGDLSLLKIFAENQKIIFCLFAIRSLQWC